MLVVGVDTGAFGAFALLDTDANDLTVYPMPRLMVRVGKTDRPRVDLHGCSTLGRAICANEPRFAVVEKVQGFGKQNAAGAFVFGVAYAAAQMALVASDCPLRFVDPAKWKKELGLSKEKENAVLEAKRLFPQFADQFESVRGVRTNEQAIGNAEATLIAYYGAAKL